MSKETFLILSVIFVIALVVAGIAGWRTRRRRQSSIPAPQSPPASFVPTAVAEGLYAATTQAADEYDRIVVHGLGLRSRARLLVGDAGIILELPERSFFTPTADITLVQRATWTIDRVVEPGGLMRYQWRLGESELATNFRVVGDDRDIFDAMLRLQRGEGTAGAAPAGRQS